MAETNYSDADLHGLTLLLYHEGTKKHEGFGQECVLNAAFALPKGMRQAHVSSTLRLTVQGSSPRGQAGPTSSATGNFAGVGRNND
jgi:hypothetical protein